MNLEERSTTCPVTEEGHFLGLHLSRLTIKLCESHNYIVHLVAQRRSHSMPMTLVKVDLSARQASNSIGINVLMEK